MAAVWHIVSQNDCASFLCGISMNGERGVADSTAQSLPRAGEMSPKPGDSIDNATPRRASPRLDSP